jgi:hypothetical protein
VTQSTTDSIIEFLQARVPKEWFIGPPQVEADEEEILCVGTLPAGGAVDGFRETTRQERMAIARETEARFGRTLSWGVEHDGATSLFTTLASPVMTRLRLRERAVLQTLIEGGIARSKSEALAWCVQLVAQHQADWLTELREALVSVEQVRVGGPTLI